ncbi:T9SS type B sorting domain-containing protein [Brumimicrobium mesophilum]|uniref:T9SS type B sorting domain-containing protein n=1 Tax=Brumimicrobium mesophilum TaxID=392717 RepID=UPI000D140EB6|nr:gliding motility-associated C-terminal domain-containing protein [Brumimicrobium mesophilum]
MKTLYSLFTFLLFSTLVYGQLSITDPDYLQTNPLNCANYNVLTANFVDDGGAADYSPNSNETFTVCPDLTAGGLKIIGSFGNATGLTWNVHSSDTLYVYDGPDANSPLLGAYNSSNAPTGFSHTASWANTSGCLTFVFVSDGSNQGTGWDANIRCISPSQDIEMHMEAFVNTSTTNNMFPLDTGYVDICQGDSVLLVAKPIFPYSFENTGSGYSQTLTNIDYLWNFSDGQVGPNNDSIWYVPNGQNGIFVSLNITDTYPHNTSMSAKIRISTTPLFSATGPIEDSVCFNQVTNLLGGIIPGDTVGVDVPLGSFQLGGTFAGLTFLPDGNGAVYTTSINMSDFDPGSTVTSASDIVSICVNMEHSYLGDLEMWLECPNGTEVAIFNGYNPGHIPGGFGGGGTFLGEPDDNFPITGLPGNGYEYCFSSINNTFGDFAAEWNTNTIPTPPTAPTVGNTMNPNGIYEPEGSLADFIGCPLNGDWTLNVQDNIGSDDGYIFEWGIFFDPSLYPNNEFYQNTITDAFWSPDPTITSNPNNDTLITVEPPGIGDYDYTFNVVDNFGCSYDTTVVLHVLDTIINVNTFGKDLLCADDSVAIWAQATGTVSPFSYQWADGQSSDTAYYAAVNNESIDYYVTVTDACGISVKDTATITLNQTLAIDTMIQTPADCGMENGTLSGMGSGFTGTPQFRWTGPGSGNTDFTTASVWGNKPSGWYYFTIKDDVCNVLDSIFLEQKDPPVADFTPTPNQGAAPLDVTFINNSDPGTTYVWDFGNGTGNTVNDMSDQYATYVNEGVYTVTLEITEGACSDITSKTITVFFPMSYDLPNVFTPNGDGQNDVFTINAQYATEVEVVIVNRWGNLVYESSDLNFAWNGNVGNDGAECTDGTYFYTLKIKGSSTDLIEEHGFVQLVRDK